MQFWVSWNRAPAGSRSRGRRRRGRPTPLTSAQRAPRPTATRRSRRPGTCPPGASPRTRAEPPGSAPPQRNGISPRAPRSAARRCTGTGRSRSPCQNRSAHARRSRRDLVCRSGKGGVSPLRRARLSSMGAVTGPLPGPKHERSRRERRFPSEQPGLRQRGDTGLGGRDHPHLDPRRRAVRSHRRQDPRGGEAARAAQLAPRRVPDASPLTPPGEATCGPCWAVSASVRCPWERSSGSSSASWSPPRTTSSTTSPTSSGSCRRSWP